MRGYLSFVLVFLSTILLLSVVSLLAQARTSDLSKALSFERSYAVQMNAKECIIETARQGAAAGFASYDASHDISLCRHCTDHFCVPPTPANPLPPNRCQESLCAQCFRESEARAASEAGALLALSSLENHRFDDEFNASHGPAVMEAYLAAEPESKNGFGLSMLRFRRELQIGFHSEKFRIDAGSKLPGNMVIRYGTADP